MLNLENMSARLYRGEVSYDFVGRQKIWYAVSAIILAVSVFALILRGLDLGVEFKGGAVFTLQRPGVTVADARAAVESVPGVAKPIVQQLGSDKIKVEVGDLAEGSQQANDIKQALATEFGVAPDQVSSQVVGSSWGEEISRKAFYGLVVFLLLVMAYLSLAFEWKMAFSAIVALIHDLVITIGIYALVGFEVTPATVIGILTILGYSLYDTVVVFDKVKENTRGVLGGNRVSYSQAANLAINQTLVRSINTSVIALLPVGSLLFVGAGLLGAGVLKDLALALFVGIATGAYSSIFIATPLLADLKEREPRLQALARRVSARQSTDSQSSKVREVVSPSSTADTSVRSPALTEPVMADIGTGRPGSPDRPRQQPRRSRNRSQRRPTGKRKRR